MKVVCGFENSHRELVTGRGLGLETTPSWVSDSAKTIFGEEMDIVPYVQRIIDGVKKDGDIFLKSFTNQLEGKPLKQIEVSKEDLRKSYERISDNLRISLEASASRVEEFHKKSLPQNWDDFDSGYSVNFVPVESAAAYIPGGTAKYPSTVLMTAIPAKVAGVELFSLACPGSNENGLPPDSVLAAAYISKVDRVYSLGGAQAIAALAYGTESVTRSDVICGPGNMFVTVAKKLVYGDVGIDGLYGPTETVILADETANPILCAADLLAQAEHDPLAKPVLITTSNMLAKETQAQLDVRVANLDRSDIAKVSLNDQGVIALVDTIEEAIRLSNAFAPEHLSISIRNGTSVVPQIRNAGMVFLGEYSHEVLGDYGAGPSHVMPTAGTARFNSGLGVHTFMKSIPVVNINIKSALEITSHASVIAREEGLTGHAEAAEIRQELL